MSKRVGFSAFVMVLVATTVAAALQQAPPESLYKRIGGYDTIAAIVHEFDARWVKEPSLSALTLGFSSDSGKRQVQLFIEYFCEQAGGPCTYIGRDMKTVHAGLNLTEAHWTTFMRILAESLDALKVPKKERGEALQIFEKVKPDVMMK